VIQYVIENVIFGVGHTAMSQAMRLSSVWPIDFKYHSQTPATAVHVKMEADFMVEQRFRTFKEAEGSVLEFTVVGP